VSSVGNMVPRRTCGRMDTVSKNWVQFSSIILHSIHDVFSTIAEIRSIEAREYYTHKTYIIQ